MCSTPPVATSTPESTADRHVAGQGRPPPGKEAHAMNPTIWIELAIVLLRILAAGLAD
jgi:hypothetical protein